jgi:ribosomal RNA assembly protein
MIYLRVPKDRVAVIIGPNGETKRMIEARSGIRIEINTKEQEATIHDEEEGVDPVMVLKVQDVLRAIARGFSPEHAMRLWSDEVYMEILDIHDYAGKQKNHARRLKGRVIGAEGKTRRIIEEQTGVDLAVYGHTVAIIGDIEDVGQAKQAVDMLLRGSEHSSVYRFLEGRRRAARRAQELW